MLRAYVHHFLHFEPSKCYHYSLGKGRHQYAEGPRHLSYTPSKQVAWLRSGSVMLCLIAGILLITEEPLTASSIEKYSELSFTPVSQDVCKANPGAARFPQPASSRLVLAKDLSEN